MCSALYIKTCPLRAVKAWGILAVMSDKASAYDEELMMLVLVLAVLGGIGWLLWTAFTPQITDGIRHVRLAEMAIVREFNPNFGVQYPDMRQPVRLAEMQQFLEKAPVKEITPKHLAISSDLALRELRIPIAVFMMLCAILILFRGPHSKFKTRHSVETLIQKQVKAFPYIKPFVDFDPSKQPPRSPGDPVPEELPLFAEALSPEEWVTYNRLTMPQGKIEPEETAAALAKQLKGRWRGWQHCPPYMQILLAAFCLRSIRKREESDDMLGRLSSCWHYKKGFSLMSDPKLLGEARALLRSKKAEEMHKLMRQHAFVTTAMVRALDHARSQGGVLSPGQFIWVRGHDRTLWYPLNNLGRQAFHPEALGAMAHYKLEKLTQRPVPSPKMDSAVAALKAYFESDFARPTPPLAYKKKSQAKGVQQGRKAGIMKPVS